MVQKISSIVRKIESSGFSDEKKEAYYQKLKQRKTMQEQRAAAATPKKSFLTKTADLARGVGGAAKSFYNTFEDFGGAVADNVNRERKLLPEKKDQPVRNFLRRGTGFAIGAGQSGGQLVIDTGKGAANAIGQVGVTAGGFARKHLLDDESARHEFVNKERIRGSRDIIDKYTFGEGERTASEKVGGFIGREIPIQIAIGLSTMGVGNVGVNSTRLARGVGIAKKATTAATVGAGTEALVQGKVDGGALFAGAIEGLTHIPVANVAKSVYKRAIGERALAKTSKKANEVFVQTARDSGIFEEIAESAQFKTKARTRAILGEVAETEGKTGRSIGSLGKDNRSAKARRADTASIKNYIESSVDLANPKSVNKFAFNVDRALAFAKQTGNEADTRIFSEVKERFELFRKKGEGVINEVEKNAFDNAALVLKTDMDRLVDLTEQLEKKGVPADQYDAILEEIDDLQASIYANGKIVAKGEAPTLGRVEEVPAEKTLINESPLDVIRDSMEGSKDLKPYTMPLSSQQASKSIISPDGEMFPDSVPPSVKEGTQSFADDFARQESDIDSTMDSVMEANKKESPIEMSKSEARQKNAEKAAMEDRIKNSERPGAIKFLKNMNTMGSSVVSTTWGTLKTLPKKVSNHMTEMISDFRGIEAEFMNNGFRYLNQLKKNFTPEELSGAIDKRKLGAELSKRDSEVLEIADQITDFYGSKILELGVKRLDGGLVELRKDFTPRAYTNYLSLKKNAQEAYVEEFYSMNKGKVKDLDEARQIIEDDVINSELGETVYSSGSISYRRESDKFDFPTDPNVSSFDAYELYIKSASNHLAKTQAFGFQPVNGKFEYTNLDGILKAGLEESDRGLAMQAFKAMIGEGDGIAKRAERKLMEGTATDGQRLLGAANAVGKVPNTAASLVVGPVAPVIYDIGNVMRTLAVNRHHALKGAFTMLLKKKNKGFLKQLQDQGVIGGNHSILLDGHEKGSKFMESLFKLQSISQNASARFQVGASIERLKSLSKKAKDGKLSNMDRRILNDEYGMGDFQIELMEKNGLSNEGYSSALIHDVQLNVTARGAGSIIRKEQLGGSLGSMAYKFYPYTLLPAAQLKRAIARGDVTTLTALSAGYLGMGKFRNEFGEGDDSSRAARFIHSLIDPNKRKLSDENTILEEYWHGMETMAGLGMYFQTLFEQDPRKLDGDTFEGKLNSKLGQMVPVGIMVDQINAVKKAGGELLNPEEDVDWEALSRTFGAARELGRWQKSKEPVKISDIKTTKEIAQRFFDGKINSDDWEGIDGAQRANVLKEVAAENAFLYGIDSPQAQGFFEEYRAQKNANNAEEGKGKATIKIDTLKNRVLEKQAEEQGISKPQLVYKIITESGNPSQMANSMDDEGLLSKADKEYIKEKTGN